MFGWRKRIGYISPGALEIPVYDFYQIAPEGVGLVSLSAPISDWQVDEYAKNLESVEEAAAYLAKRHVHMVIHAGAPPVASQGGEFMRDLIRRMRERTGLPASTALFSAMEAFRWLGAKRLTVVTPFPPETHRSIVSLLEEEGFTVAHEERMDAAYFTLHEIRQRQSYDFVTSALKRGRSADAGYVPCPQWHVFEMVDYLERDTGLPLVTSNGGDFWYAFHTLGVTDVKPGHGILLDRLRERGATELVAPIEDSVAGVGVASLRRRLLAARDELHTISVSPPDRFGPPDPDTGERWNRGNVLGHMAEILPFWSAQIMAAAKGATSIGRTAEGNQRRRSAIDSGPERDEDSLMADIDAAVAEVLAQLDRLSPAELDIRVDHVRANETKVKSLRELLDQLLVHHFEVHVEQLRELS
jgi:maleate isomerase